MTAQRLFAEALGTLLLVCTVVGSGIMAVNMSGGNDGVALLGNTLATAGHFYVLITVLGPVSGAHFNPAVSLVFALRGELTAAMMLAYVVVQCAGGVAGMLAHAMFECPCCRPHRPPAPAPASGWLRVWRVSGCCWLSLAASGTGRMRWRRWSHFTLRRDTGLRRPQVSPIRRLRWRGALRTVFPAFARSTCRGFGWRNVPGRCWRFLRPVGCGRKKPCRNPRRLNCC